MKTKYLFSLAALALTLGACTSDEITQSKPASSAEKIPFKAIINADAAGTRGLTETTDGKSITAKWEKGEVVAVVHGQIVDVLTVESVDATSGAAIVTGEITSPADGESTMVVYAGHEDAMVKSIKSDLGNGDRTTDITYEEITNLVKAGLNSQEGTLDDINKYFDYRLGEATFVVSDGNATFGKAPTLDPQFAVLKVSLTTDGTTALAAKKLVMKSGTDTAAAIDLKTATKSTFYVAFAPDGTSTSYTFEATDAADKEYSYTLKLGSALQTGKYYRSTLKMEAPTTYREYTAKDTYTDKKTPSNATTLTGTVTPGFLDGGTYVVSGEATLDGDLTFRGDADLILKDGASLTITGAIVADEHTLNIYGQAEGTGKLSATDGKGSIAISAKNLNVHGGKITIPFAYTGIKTESTFTIYNGIINSAGSNNGIIAKGPMNVYGGEITASSSGNGSAIYLNDGNCKLTIAGGKVTATNTGNLYGIDAAGGLRITGGTVTAQGGKRARGEGKEGIFTYGYNITISGGDVTAIGGDADAESNGYGGAGIYGVLTVNGGTVTATGGAKDGSGNDGFAISTEKKVSLGTGISLYAGDSPNSTSPAKIGPVENVTPPENRYVVIK